MKYCVVSIAGLALAVAAVVAFLLGTASASSGDESARDMAEIEKLHRNDVTATLSGDPAALAQLWTDDAVRLQQGEEAILGRAAIQAADERERKAHPNARIVSYVPDIRDVTIEGTWAFEWGYFAGSYSDGTNKEATAFRAKLLRVLKKEKDGSWRFARVMWNTSD